MTDPAGYVPKFEALAAARRDSRLSRGDLAVLAVILDRYNAASGVCWPGVNRIAEDAHLDRRSVIRATQRLESLALIAVERADRGKSNRYRPNLASSGVSATSDTRATSGASVTQLVAPVSPELVAPVSPESLKRTPKGTPKEKQRASADALTLPDWVDQQAWDGFATMRVRERHPLTPRAVELVLVELAKLREAGQDPNAVLDQSTRNGWRDVYQIKQQQQLQTRGAASAPSTSRTMAAIRAIGEACDEIYEHNAQLADARDQDRHRITA